MAESSDIKFEHQNSNVEAEVPGAQNMRRASKESSFNGQSYNSESSNPKSSNLASSKVSMDLEVVPTDDFSLEPVIVVTKKEATFTEGDLKLQKVTEDAQSRRIIRSYTEVRSEVMEEGKVIRRHNQVITGDGNGEPAMIENKEVEDKKPRTKIPVSKFRQTVEKVKTERRNSKDKKEHESHIPVRRTSIPKPVRNKDNTNKELTVTKTEVSQTTTEPDDEFDKIYAEIIDSTPTEANSDDNILDLNVEDPEQLESTFEEIIHDDDENKVEPIDVEKVKRSKIPFLKRRSQQDIELSAQAERTSKILAARDKIRLRHSLNSNDNFEEELDRELKKAQANFPVTVSQTVHKDHTSTADNQVLNEEVTETDVSNELKDATNYAAQPKTKTEKEFKHEVISSPNARKEIKTEFTKTISNTSNGTETSASFISETTTVKEVTTSESKSKEENKQFIGEENIAKDFIKIGIPVFESYVHESSENTAKSVEVKTVLSYTSNTEESSTLNKVSEIKNDVESTEIEFENNSEHISGHFKLETQTIDNETQAISYNDKPTKIENNKDTNTEENKPEKAYEVVKLREKVERRINKLDSKEVIETEENKRESIHELMKKKSVLSKIAMFEKTEPEGSVKIKYPKKDIKLPLIIPKDAQKTHVHINTPLIVDQVYKPFQVNDNLNNKVNKEEDPVKTNDGDTFEKSERIEFIAPESAHYSIENKVQLETKKIDDNSSNKETIASETLQNKIEINGQAKLDSKLSIHKAEYDSATNKYQTSIKDSEHKVNECFVFNRLKSREVHDKEGITKDVTNFENDKEIAEEKTKAEEPAVIPGFRTVSELLRSFENKNFKKTFHRRHTSKETTKEFQHKKEIQKDTLHSMTQSLHYQSNEIDSHFESHDYKSLDDVFTRETDLEKMKLRQEDDLKRAKSLAELDLGDAVKGKVNNMISRMMSVDRIEIDRKEVPINMKEMPRKRSVSEKIALFEGKLTPSRSDSPHSLRVFRPEKNIPEALRTEKKIETPTRTETSVKYREVQKGNDKEIDRIEKTETSDKNDEEQVQKKIEDLRNAKKKYGTVENMPVIELSNGQKMPVLAVGTALIDSRLINHVIAAAIDIGYRAIDTAFIYGNEKQVGDAIKAKIDDGTVKREDLFIISKLWSTYHRTDLVETACRASLEAMGLDYFDLYLIHNPMSFKEGGAPIPKIATVIQFSEHDYLNAWFGMETLVSKGLVRGIGVSNFNSAQLQRIVDKGRIKPVVNQVECHPYLSQQRLDQFCSERNVTLSCFGVLGSKGTPAEFKSGQPAAIDDALVQVMASGLNMTAAQLLISYQIDSGRGVVVKSSSANHLWDNLQSVNKHLSTVQVDALNALNRNKRIFTFKGMGDTHKNYPFNIAF